MRVLRFLLLGPVATASLLPDPPSPPVPPALPSAVGLLLPPPPPPPVGADLPPPGPAGPVDDAFRIQTISVDTAPGLPLVPAPTPVAATTPFPEPPPPPPAAPLSPPALQGDAGGPARRPASTVVLAGECRLMGPFAIVVQLGLGGLAMLALVFKRWRERPQRPVRIWLFDVSKQVFGSVLVHGANVFLSLLTSGRLSIGLAPQLGGAAAAAAATLPRAGDPYTPNPCSFYLLNLGIDTTLGIPILLFLLRLTTAVAARTPLGQPPASIQSGNYGRPPRAGWWLKQSLLYCCGLFGMKVCVLGLFLALPWLVRVGDWALRWTEGDERLQIVFVMMLFPLLMNALQYYIIDSYIMEQPAAAAVDGDGDGAACDDTAYADSSDDDDDDGDDGDDEHDRLLTPTDDTACSNKAAAPAGSAADYDPALDGDSPTIIGSSTSQWLTRTGSASARHAALPKDLSPPA